MVVRKCASCAKSQSYKDAEHCIILAEASGQKDVAFENDLIIVDSVMPLTSDDGWCCMQCVLFLQEDFQAERPLIQLLIKDLGHNCLFLSQFHCEFNPIEMLWGYGKYHMCIPLAHSMCGVHTLTQLLGYHNLADGRFISKKKLFPLIPFLPPK